MQIKREVKPDSMCYIRVIRKYFEALDDIELELRPKDVSELLRYSLCDALSLESKCAMNDLNKIALEKCIPVLKTALKEEGVSDKPLEYRQVFVEACMYYIEAARRKVENDGKCTL